MNDRKKLGLDELEQTQEYQSLTPKQRLFCATYCAGGLLNGIYDPVAATQTAYVCKNNESARVMSYALMGNIRIIAALNRHFNSEPIEQFIVEVDRAIRNKNLSTAQLQALKLKADLLGFSARIPGADRQAFDRIPAEVKEETKEARKAKRKQPERKVKEPVVEEQPKPPSKFDEF